MKSKLLIAISALSVILALPLLAQGQGGGGGQWSGGTGSFDMEAMQKRWVERAVEESDTDDDGELSKEEFLSMATNERYSYWFEEADSEEESEDEEAESAEVDEDAADEGEGDDGEEESEEDALVKLHEAKFDEADADDDGNVTVDELIATIDFEAAMENMRERFQRGGGGQQQGGQGGGNWQRPGGGSP